MPRFGKSSEARLSTCHADLQKIFNKVIQYTDCSIFSGHRGEDEQNLAYEKGFSQLPFPQSKHNSYPSHAVDAGPYFIELKNTDWSDKVAFGVFAGQVKQIALELFEKGETAHLLRWGGDWDGDGRSLDESFSDLPHFELIKP